VPVKLNIEVQDDGTVKLQKFQGSLKDTGDAATTVGQKFKSAFSAIDSHVSSMHSKIASFATGLPGLLGVASVTAGIGKIIQAGMQEEAMYLRLKTTIQSVGASYRDVQPAVLSFIADMQKTTQFGDGEVVPVLQEIVQMTGSVKSGFTGTKLALDMASSGLLDVSSAGRYVAMAMTGNVQMLGRFIPALKEGNGVIYGTMDNSQKAAAAMAYLQKQFGGQATANLSGFAAIWKQIKNYFGDIVELVGTKITDSLTPIFDRWRNKIIEFTEDGGLEKWAEGVGKKISDIVGGMQNFFNFLKKHQDLLRAVAVGILGVVVAVEALHIGFLVLSANHVTLIIAGVVVAIAALAAGIDYAVRKTIGWSTAWEYIKAAIKTVWDVLVTFAQFIGTFAGSVGQWFASLGEVIWGALTFNPDKIKSGIQGMANAVKGGFDGMVSSAKTGWNKIEQEWEKANKKIETNKLKVDTDKAGNEKAATDAWQNFKDGWNSAQASNPLQVAYPDFSKGQGIRGTPWGSNALRDKGNKWREDLPFVESVEAPKGATEAVAKLESQSSNKFKSMANAFRDAFSASAQEVQSELSGMWDKIFGKSNNIFAKMAKSFLTAMTNALMQYAARQAAVFALNAVGSAFGIPGLGNLVNMFHHGGLVMHGGGIVPRMHGGGLAPDERLVINQTGEHYTRRPSVNPNTLPTLSYINENGRVPVNQVSIGGSSIQVNGGVLDEGTISRIRNLVSRKESDLQEEIQALIDSRRLRLGTV
jgi:hypothetical protein